MTMIQIKPTKFFSDRQEKAIADYLGWSVVAASGATQFNKGDVIADDWLGECKTHTTEKTRSEFNYGWLKKLIPQSTAIRRSPVVFFDNGTQKIEDTWCIVQRGSIVKNITIIDAESTESIIHILVSSTIKVTFNHKLMLEYIKAYTTNETPACIKIDINCQPLLLMRLIDFKSAITF